jgi:hypothetical protein
VSEPAAGLPADLRQAITDQAQARVDMNIQGYAKLLTPEAIDSLRSSFRGIPPRVNRHEIDAVEGGVSEYSVDVRYFSRDDSFVVRSRWRKRGEGWLVVHAERLWAEGDKRPSLISRLAAKMLGPLARRRSS